MNFKAPRSSLSVMYEDDHLLAIHKPHGLPSNPLNKEDKKETAVDFALQHCKLLQTSFPDSFEPGLLHRLDVDTSGVLLFAKNESAFTRLRNFWKTEAVRKFYTAWVTDSSQTLSGAKLPLELTHPIARSLNHKSRMIVIDRPGMRLYRGNPLEAHTRILSAKNISESETIHELEIEILTGVMHQIRAHLSHHQIPIVGDALYKGIDFSRLCLHSTRIDIDQVIFGRPISIK